MQGLGGKIVRCQLMHREMYRSQERTTPVLSRRLLTRITVSQIGNQKTEVILQWHRLVFDVVVRPCRRFAHELDLYLGCCCCSAPLYLHSA